jgi:hypothetical protein
LFVKLPSLTTEVQNAHDFREQLIGVDERGPLR